MWARAISKLPLGVRRRAATMLPRRLTRTAAIGATLQDRAWWDRYFAPDDPWGFDTNPDEKLKYQRTLEVCGEGPFARALEIACAQGAFTELLAKRCEELLAVDISATAVARASRRLRRFQHVRCEVATLPPEFPGGQFDLVVASDVFYYWPPRDILSCLSQIENSLVPGGDFVVLHYMPAMGALLDGNEVHDLLHAHASLPCTLVETREFGSGRPYRIARFSVPADDRRVGAATMEQA